MKSFSLIFLRFYVKLQDAYVSEKGTAVGSWKQIGYLMKNSNNFYYCGAATCALGSNTDGYGGQEDITVADGATNYTGGVWTAHNIATLNDCQVGDNWKITTAANNTTGGTVLYDATVAANCEPLTANFTKLKTTAAITGQGDTP